MSMQDLWAFTDVFSAVVCTAIIVPGLFAAVMLPAILTAVFRTEQ